MATKSANKRQRKKLINLSGPEGNAHFLLALTRILSYQHNKDANSICEKMKSGDYENLLTVFLGEFGDYVDVTW